MARAFETSHYNPSIRDYDWVTMLVMRTDDGHVLKWNSSTVGDEVEPGDRLLLTSGSVKAHSQYNGVDQTVLTRVRFEKLDTDGLPVAGWEQVDGVVEGETQDLGVAKPATHHGHAQGVER
jgi:hypothetical protein